MNGVHVYVCMSLYQYVKVSNWRNMSMNRTYSTSYLMAKIDNLCLLILTFMTNSMTVKYTTWVNTISFFNTCNYMILDFAELRCLVLLSAQFLNCSTYMPRIFSKSEYQRFPFFFLIGFWRYTHQCLMMSHSFRRSFDSSVWPWGCQVRWQRAPCRLWERSCTSHRDLWLACLIGPQLGGKPETSLKMSTSRGEILYWIEYFFRVCTLF